MVTKSQDRIEARLAARFALTEAGTKLAKQMKAAARNTIRRTARQPPVIAGGPCPRRLAPAEPGQGLVY